MQTLKGMFDIIDERPYYALIRKTIESVATQFHVKKIETPLLEATELFHRGLGDGSDVVRKETYTFEDRGKRLITLRPEGTASVVRAYIEHKLYALPQTDQSFYYEGPMFRYERPQKGRFRQFYSAGFERFGSASPAADLEVIQMAHRIVTQLGLDVTVELNSLGTARKQAYIDDLKAHLKPHLNELCADCQARFETNPLRMLDCKVDFNHPVFLSAPAPETYLSEEETAHFETVKKGLTHLKIPFTINPKLVRGLDYYTQTVFELKVSETLLGQQNTVCGGGRYDLLVKELGGPSVPAVGFGFGLERLVVALKALDKHVEDAPLDVYMVVLGPVLNEALALATTLRNAGFSVKVHPQEAPLKTQFKQVEHEKAHFALIIGEEEIKTNVYPLKDQIHGGEQKVPADQLVHVLTSHGEAHA
jgi:histidyl-tRNA synthetase